MNRRTFIRSAGWVAVAAGGAASGWFGAGLVEYMGASPDTPWKAFTPEEAEEVERLAEELIPADEYAPGAKDAKAARFIDWQLAPHRPYERHLKTYREHLAKTKGLSAAEVEKQFPAFFKMLLAHVNQGYYSHPCQGGNVGFASYRLCGLSTITGRNIPGQENHL